MSNDLRCSSCKAGVLCQCKTKQNKKRENVNHPDHYLRNSGHEVIDVIGAWNLNFELGNAVKYIARAGKKDSNKAIEDLEKSIWYIKRQIENISK